MKGPDTILPAARRGSTDEAPAGSGILRIGGSEAVECLFESRRHQRLAELRVARSESDRTGTGASRVYREALDAFVWGLPPALALTLIFAFDDVGAFSLQTLVSTNGRTREDADAATRDTVSGFEAALAAAALPCRFAEGTVLRCWLRPTRFNHERTMKKSRNRKHSKKAEVERLSKLLTKEELRIARLRELNGPTN